MFEELKKHLLRWRQVFFLTTRIVCLSVCSISFPVNMTTDNYSLTRDPLYYIMVGFFAAFTTILPALMGQPRFLPFIQTLILTLFIAVPLRRHHPRGALNVLAIWLPLQFFLITLLTRFFGTQLEHAFIDGFAYRGAITAWFFGGALHPSGIIATPFAYVIEFLGVILGSLVSLGLIGTWFLVRLTDQAAFGTGILLTSLVNPGQSLLVLPYWSLLRASGYAGFVILCAQPLLINNWSPLYYWQTQRKLVVYSTVLLIAGLLLELFLPNLLVLPPIT
jgi:hypothetical protein